MTLAQQIQLENLKGELQPLIDKIKMQNEELIVAAVKAAVHQFHEHFTKAGFTLSGALPNPIVAKYQSLQYVLNTDTTPKSAAFAVFQTGQVGQGHKLTPVFLRRAGYSGPKVVIRTGAPDPVKDLQSSIQEATKTLEGPPLQLTFQVEQSGSTNSKPLLKSYDSFAKVLQDLAP
ncbi:hypothetical protein [Caballeronia sp. dw_276]|uniref:hypothetical protein n=1 Tax=Caballeronia sp. dw_276 TaxID=2719795 RepID=UPI001BD34932|nr:hypothetical protein [Caballeronia sp. dw_276]